MQYGKSQEAIDRLTAEQRRVTQEACTERPFTGEYNDHTEPGIYVDIVSGEPLFASSDKFESGCGWPSFTKPIVSANINELRDGGSQKPNQQVLQLQDNSVVLEGGDVEDIAVQLRRKYHDESHKRFLRRERDYEAERRKAAAMETLIEILAKAAVDELLREQERGSGDLDAEQGGPAQNCHRN